MEQSRENGAEKKEHRKPSTIKEEDSTRTTPEVTPEQERRKKSAKETQYKEHDKRNTINETEKMEQRQRSAIKRAP